MQRIITRSEDSDVTDILECENFFRADGSFRSFVRDAFKVAIENNYTVEFHGDTSRADAIRVMQEAYNEAINFAIDDDEPKAFLEAWREGDWGTLRKYWPEFKLPPFAKI